ncbi:MAG: hypothetical protein ABS955_11520, partial [Stenotrophomonas maltophilia]
LNRAHDSVVALDVAPAGTEAFAPRSIDALAGGGAGTTVRLADEGCRFDLRVAFRNGRRAIYRDVDVCRGDTLVIVPLKKTPDELSHPCAACAAPPGPQSSR